MKVYLCITVGQEIDGKNVVVRIDKASQKKEDIQTFIQSSRNPWTEAIEVPGGKVNFFCERNLQEVEVEL